LWCGAFFSSAWRGSRRCRKCHRRRGGMTRRRSWSNRIAKHRNCVYTTNIN
jgi:hypothetical protein